LFCEFLGDFGDLGDFGGDLGATYSFGSYFLT